MKITFHFMTWNWICVLNISCTGNACDLYWSIEYIGAIWRSHNKCLIVTKVHKYACNCNHFQIYIYILVWFNHYSSIWLVLSLVTEENRETGGWRDFSGALCLGPCFPSSSSLIVPKLIDCVCVVMFEAINSNNNKYDIHHLHWVKWFCVT